MPGVLYHNGDILTMELQLYVQAVLIEGGAYPCSRHEAAAGGNRRAGY